MRTVTVQGVRIPAIGLGTSSLLGGVAKRMVRRALEIGYRHIDTAQNYGNEAEIGEAIRASAVPRQDIWLTTKIDRNRFRDGDLQRSVEDSVRKLGTKPDLVLLHWPNAKVPLRETLAALNEVKRRGLTRQIGVSNFTAALVRQAVSLSEAPLIVNQVEYHPYLSQPTVLKAVRANGMALTAYSPLAKGRVFRDSTLRSIGARHGKTAGQVALRWLVQQDGVIAIPRSSREAHAESNLAIFDFELTGPEMNEIFALGSSGGRLIDPLGVAPAWDDLEATGQVGRNVKRLVRAVGARLRRRLR